MINLSLEHGNTDGSCLAYVWLGRIAGYRFGNYQACFRFGRLGCDLVERSGLERFKARTYISFFNFCLPWAEHVRAGLDLIRRAFDAANTSGDLTHGAFSCSNLVCDPSRVGRSARRRATRGRARPRVCPTSSFWCRDRRHHHAAWFYPHPPRLDGNVRLLQRGAVRGTAVRAQFVGRWDAWGTIRCTPVLDKEAAGAFLRRPLRCGCRRVMACSAAVLDNAVRD